MSVLHHRLDAWTIHASVRQTIQKQRRQGRTLCKALGHDEFFVRMNPAAPDAERINIGYAGCKDVVSLADTACIDKFEIKTYCLPRCMNRFEYGLLRCVPRFRRTIESPVNVPGYAGPGRSLRKEPVN